TGARAKSSREIPSNSPDFLLNVATGGESMARIVALIVGAGSGTRLGSARPKQYLPLAGIPVMRRALEAFEGQALFVQPVIGAGQAADYEAAMAGLYLLPPVTGGATRAE